MKDPKLIIVVSAFAAFLATFNETYLNIAFTPIAGRIYDRFGAWNLLPTGFFLICIFACLLTVFRGNGSLLLFALLYIPVICGSALIIGPVQSFALSFLKPELIRKQVKEVGIRRVISVKASDSLEEVCRVLQENHLKKAPVMDGEEMVGIINSSNITKFALNRIMEKG